jgi:predicted small lipoprotein YifL
MKRFMLFAAMFVVFTFALAACCGSKKSEEAPAAEVVEDATDASTETTVVDK